jgi:hypothetical protein
MIDKEDEVYIFDFQHAGYLPESLMNLAVHHFVGPLGKAILARRPHWASNPNLEGLGHARYLLAMTNNNRLGKTGLIHKRNRILTRTSCRPEDRPTQE